MASTSDLIINEVRKVIHGKDEVIKLTLCAILAGGHVLLEDIPYLLTAFLCSHFICHNPFVFIDLNFKIFKK